MHSSHIIAAEVLLRRESDGKYLILRSTEWPERPDRSQKLDIPGGMVDQGETTTQAAVRELREETGVAIRESDLSGGMDFDFMWYDGRPAKVFMYFATITEDVRVSLSWEHEAFYWYSAEELRDIEIRQPFRHILDILIDQGQIK